jgi:U2 small nuclear ribonucleoprotein A'
MRISAETIQQAEQRVNPDGERELVLRELAIPFIENMGAARDDYDAWDLTNNRIVRLENFPRVRRLATLHCSGNNIESVDAINISKNANCIRHLYMSDNNIASLGELVNIGEACAGLEHLCLVGNAVTRQQHYRLFAIAKIPSLKVLDFRKIKPGEREKAAKFAISTAGAALEEDVQKSLPKTFVPGEALDGGRSFTHRFTAAEKEKIRAMLDNAMSAKDVEAIENAVSNGVLPAGLVVEENQPDSKRRKV